MLTHLIINNYALIDSLDVEFYEGFSVITGETGAGKSIILGAIGLLLGERADAKIIKQGAQQCRIEAHFKIADPSFFNENDIEFDGGECILTRTISASGKSRMFINDTPCTLAQAKELGQQLIDIHSQHKNLLLQTTGFQLALVDAMAQNADLRNAYTKTYTAYCDNKKTLDELLQRQSQLEREADYIQFQLQQLTEAAVTPHEDEELEQELMRLTHAQDLVQSYQSTFDALSADGVGAIYALRAAMQALRTAENIDAESRPLMQRIDEAYIELKDISQEIDRLASSVVVDPERLQQVQERADQINQLLHKHHLGSAADLVALKEELERQANSFSNLADDIEKYRKAVDEAQLAMNEAAEVLSRSRHAATQPICRHIVQTLSQLGMPNAQMQINISRTPNPTPTGIDAVEFKVLVNKSGTFSPLSTLSGGEAARVMLSVKDLLTGATQLPTIIFDEIDTGVSGAMAESMANIMQRMGNGDRQVISITHLPQIAAKGSHHYKVYKTDDEHNTHTHIRMIEGDSRVDEIAAMLSGNDITVAAIDNARALLKEHGE